MNTMKIHCFVTMNVQLKMWCNFFNFYLFYSKNFEVIFQKEIKACTQNNQTFLTLFLIYKTLWHSNQNSNSTFQFSLSLIFLQNFFKQFFNIVKGMTHRCFLVNDHWEMKGNSTRFRPWNRLECLSLSVYLKCLGKF